MLCWMIYRTELDAYFASGRVVPYTSAYNFQTFKQTWDGVEAVELAVLLRTRYEEEVVQRVISTEQHDNVFADPIEWNNEDSPQIVSPIFFEFAQEIDWDGGTLQADINFDEYKSHYSSFSDDEHFSTDFPNASFKGSLSGLCFDHSAVEMLLPNSNAVLLSQALKTDVVRQRGRPTKWDWEGAMAHVVGLAQRPDGLPVGHGAQSTIEKAMSEWFVRQFADQPAQSQIRQRAQMIMVKIALVEK